MVILIIIGLILLILLSGLCYLIIWFIARIVVRLINPQQKVNSRVILILSIVTAVLAFSCLLFYSPEKNYETAYRERKGDSVFLKVKGRRVLMGHDPISILSKKTYEDSVLFILPRENGVIQSSEIKFPQFSYIPNGTITIENQEMSIKLFSDNNQTEPLSWNGKYKLISK